MLLIPLCGHQAEHLTWTMNTEHLGPTGTAGQHSTKREINPDQPHQDQSGGSHNYAALAPRLISLTDVMDRVALKRTSIYQLVKTKDFPAPVKIQRASRWVDQEITAWIREQMTKR